MKSKSSSRIVILFVLLVSLFIGQANVFAAPPLADNEPSSTIIIDTPNLLRAVGGQTTYTVGDTIPLAVTLQSIPTEGFTSAEFSCRYDPALGEISGLADAGLFGTGAAIAVNGPQTGSFVFAIAGSNGNKATAGGSAVRFNLKALQAGQFTITCTVRASKGDNSLMDIIFVPVTLTFASVAPGTLTGKVIASKPVTVSLYTTSGSRVTSVVANTAGTFSLTAPAGNYTVIASASGFLNAQGTARLTAGQTTTMPQISLLPGDIDGNGKIDQYDVLTIGANYNNRLPAAADLNNDGIVNVLDLQLLARNYPKTGPVTWQ